MDEDCLRNVFWVGVEEEKELEQEKRGLSFFFSFFSFFIRTVIQTLTRPFTGLGGCGE